MYFAPRSDNGYNLYEATFDETTKDEDKVTCKNCKNIIKIMNKIRKQYPK